MFISCSFDDIFVMIRVLKAHGITTSPYFVDGIPDTNLLDLISARRTPPSAEVKDLVILSKNHMGALIQKNFIEDIKALDK
jgi:hypothetical protein